ncbi:MAG: sigma-70 family RNA polymerase sigma factor [Ferruginibacter sp.]
MQTANDNFLILLQENKRILFKICNAYCNNAADREDLAQEMIYQLWKSFQSYNTEYRFSTWMYRVALNVAISFYRKEKRTFQKVMIGDQVLTLTDDNLSSSELEANIILLQQFIHELKELDRALMLLYLEEKSYLEIAEILGITETNIATKISRIKEKLKTRFRNINTF